MIIYLIGFMGAGKSHWGKLWAAEKGIAFYDLDQLLEEQEGCTIAELFEGIGELAFREKESHLLRSLPLPISAIVACGGGTACYHQNMQWMNSRGITVYLMATASQLCQRLASQSAVRPLIARLAEGTLPAFVASKLAERLPHYLNSRIHLPISSLELKTIHDILHHKF